ncbi:MAG TPA: high-potential iron-sulfur protein [Thiobacillaceae bacterium]|nr:high-potential iron-sulfur protein [Thiobacillaceae bacterium]
MESHNHQRRAILRGVLAAGCVLSVPMVTGCKPKDSTKPTESSAPGGDVSTSQGSTGPEPASQAASPSAAAKVSQAQAKYQSQPKGDQMCGNCANFIAPDSCKLVEGKVSASGWCTLWARKQA